MHRKLQNSFLEVTADGSGGTVKKYNKTAEYRAECATNASDNVEIYGESNYGNKWERRGW